MIIEWAYAARALGDPVEGPESGDLHVVRPFSKCVLVGVIDGLGHGTEASLAARAAANVLEAHPDEELETLIRRCHVNLVRTRGVVMSLVCFNVPASSMTWTGVGNVEAALIRPHATATSRYETLPLRGGIVGYQIPALRPKTVGISPGDTLIMITDGIQGNFVKGIDPHDSPQSIADSILARHGSYSDDALALVARYVGMPEES